MTLTQGAVPQWRDISTAPKDGTPILAANKDGEIAVLASHGGGWFAPVYDMSGIGVPTHWMPLPPPPEQP